MGSDQSKPSISGLAFHTSSGSILTFALEPGSLDTIRILGPSDCPGGNDAINLTSLSMNRRHATIELRENQVFITDMYTTHGTQLRRDTQNHRLQEGVRTLLLDRDIIILGRSYKQDGRDMSAACLLVCFLYNDNRSEITPENHSSGCKRRLRVRSERFALRVSPKGAIEYGETSDGIRILVIPTSPSRASNDEQAPDVEEYFRQLPSPTPSPSTGTSASFISRPLSTQDPISPHHEQPAASGVPPSTTTSPKVQSSQLYHEPLQRLGESFQSTLPTCSERPVSQDRALSPLPIPQDPVLPGFTTPSTDNRSPATNSDGDALYCSDDSPRQPLLHTTEPLGTPEIPNGTAFQQTFPAGTTGAHSPSASMTSVRLRGSRSLSPLRGFPGRAQSSPASAAESRQAMPPLQGSQTEPVDSTNLRAIMNELRAVRSAVNSIATSLDELKQDPAVRAMNEQEHVTAPYEMVERDLVSVLQKLANDAGDIRECSARTQGHPALMCMLGALLVWFLLALMFMLGASSVWFLLAMVA